MVTQKEKDRQEAIQQLKEILHPGDKVYTEVKHVSRSGMMRHIKVIIIRDNQPRDISYKVAKVIGEPMADDGAIKVGGCGMDMGFSVVYSLSSALFKDNFTCIGKTDKRETSCPSNDHVNGDKDYTPHLHSDAGYALRQQWL